MFVIVLFMLVFILFAFVFLYFSGINPGEITIFFTSDQSVTAPVAIIIIGTILVGLLLGNGVHLFSTIIHSLNHMRRNRREKKSQEVAVIYREGVGCLLSGDVKKAHGLLQKALDRDPARVETYIALANVLQQEGNPNEAISLLLKARGIDARSLEVLFKLASTYEENGQDDKAVSSYLDLLALEKTNRKALRCLREIHIRHGRWAEALNLQEQVMKVGVGANRLTEETSKLLSLRYEVARKDLEAGNLDAAKKALKEIIKEDANFVPSRVSLGDAYLQQQRPEDAVRVWRAGYTALGKSVFLSRLEDYFLADENPSGLLDIYKTFMDERGDDLILRLFYGKLCLRLEMVDESLEQLYALEGAGIETPQLNLLLAEAHRRRNRFDEAVRQYKKALGVDGRLRLSYTCEGCDAVSSDWQSRCPECGCWGSFIVSGRKQIMTSKLPAEARPIHHGERQ